MAELFAWGRKQSTSPLVAAITSLTNGAQKGCLFWAICYGSRTSWPHHTCTGSQAHASCQPFMCPYT